MDRHKDLAFYMVDRKGTRYQLSEDGDVLASSNGRHVGTRIIGFGKVHNSRKAVSLADAASSGIPGQGFILTDAGRLTSDRRASVLLVV